MFEIPRKADLALLFLSALANKTSEKPVSLREIAFEKHIPYRFLTQIIIPLREVGIVGAKEGKNGGYFLLKKPQKITVADILKATVGGFSPTICTKHGVIVNCPQLRVCKPKSFWSSFYKDLDKKMQSSTLADFLD